MGTDINAQRIAQSQHHLNRVVVPVTTVQFSSWQLNRKYDEIHLTGSPDNELYNESPKIKYDLSSTFDEYLDSNAL